MLFEEKDRNRGGYANFLEDSFHYYDTSSNVEIKQVRDLLNNWFLFYPEESRKELKARFKKDFKSSFFELFIHELFRCEGYEIDIHPSMVDTANKPDFLISKDSQEIIVEAKVALGLSREDIAQENRDSNLFDELNKINSPHFYIGIRECLFKGQQQPNGKRIRRQIEKWLDTLDPFLQRTKLVDIEIPQIPNILIEDEKIRLLVDAIARADSQRGNQSIRPLGSLLSKSRWGGSDDILRRAFLKKISKYPNINRPYLIALNSLTPFHTTTNDVLSSVFGQVEYHTTNASSSGEYRVIGRKGSLVENMNGPMNTHVSGFLVTHVNVHNISSVDNWLVQHPNAKFPIDFDGSKLSYWHEENSLLKYKNGHSISEILGIQ